MSDKPLTAVAEIATSDADEVLWVDRYQFSRLEQPGAEVVRDSVRYIVVRSSITIGHENCALVETVLRKVNEVKLPPFHKFFDGTDRQ